MAVVLWSAIACTTLAVVVFMAFLVSTQHRPSRELQTFADAQEVRSAVLLYMGQEAGADCPTMADLQEAGVLDSGRRTTDAWDRPFLVECNDDDIEVISTGPDRTKRTADDIR